MAVVAPEHLDVLAMGKNVRKEGEARPDGEQGQGLGRDDGAYEPTGAGVQRRVRPLSRVGDACLHGRFISRHGRDRAGRVRLVEELALGLP